MDTKQITFLPKTTIIPQLSDHTTNQPNANNLPTPTTDPTLKCWVVVVNSQTTPLSFPGSNAPKFLIQTPYKKDSCCNL